MEMDLQGWIALGTLVGAAVLFVTKWIPIGVTALSIPVVLAATGVIEDPKQALVGFGNHAVIAIGSVLVVSAALQESGVATLMARGLQRVGGRREGLLVALLMLSTAGVSVLMNNAAAVALVLPAAVSLCRRAVIAPSRLLMPVAFASVLGGTVSVIGTAPNLIMADYIETTLHQHVHVFDFAPVGLAIVLSGIVYMVVFGRRLLPQRTSEDRLRAARLPEDVASSYGLPDNLFIMRVVEQSRIAGRTIHEAALRPRYGLSVVMVARPAPLGARRYLEPRADLVLEPEDRIYVEGGEVDAWHCAEEELLQFGLAGRQALEKLLGRGITLAEVMIPPGSLVVGQTLRDLDFRQHHGVNVLSLWRRGAAARQELSKVPLDVGDTILVSGPVANVRAMARMPDYIVLTDQSGVEDAGRAPLAIGLLLVAVLPPIFSFLPLAVSALASALLMVLTGCLSVEGLRRAVDWKVLAMIVGTLPLGQALLDHQVAEGAARGLVGLTVGLGEPAVLTALFSLAALVAMFSTNAAGAVIVAPVAVKAAEAASLDPRTALFAVAYGCSCAFVLPFAQCNLLVITPGGYVARDFLRTGIGLLVVMGIVTVLGLQFLL